MQAVQNMFVVNKSLHTVKTELQKKKDKESGLKCRLQMAEQTNKIQDEEIAFLVRQLKELREKHDNTQGKLEVARNDLGGLRQELDTARVRLSFLERKERFYPLKKKKIYKEVVDTTTLVVCDKMKKLIVAGKINSLSPLFDFDSNLNSSANSLFIDLGRDLDLEVELNTTSSTKDQSEKIRADPEDNIQEDEHEEEVNIKDI